MKTAHIQNPISAKTAPNAPNTSKQNIIPKKN